MRLLSFAILLALLSTTWAAEGNRLTYLDESDPYYVSRTFPRLTTPQWVGEDGVEAVVVLAIDDMRGHERWETYLRPILRRLAQIDGRAPVSIMTNRIDPGDPHLQTWLKEGLSLDTHTFHHPCPLLQGDNFDKARQTYERCIDLLAAVPNSRPVAFRMPCCDSINSPSPRFYAEIFNKTTSTTPPTKEDREKKDPKGKDDDVYFSKVKSWGGNFLTIDSSVFNLLTANDAALPRELVVDPDGKDRFRKYLPADRTFVNTIDDYPYPYVIGRLCWEFPCVTPSDWQAQHRHKPFNPQTVNDWKAALDAIVIKQGVFTLVFHPHGWIKAEQVIELIDHAVTKHGKKVKFLTFREAQERLDKNLLGGQPLRTPPAPPSKGGTGGQDNGVRLLDLNNDGYLDVVIGNDKVRQTRLWSPKTGKWVVSDFPRAIDGKTHFGVIQAEGRASFLHGQSKELRGWHFNGSQWVDEATLVAGLSFDKERALRLRDLDRDGRCELIVASPEETVIFTYSLEKKSWVKLPFTLPAGTTLVTADGKDAGLRFVDIDEDGYDDVIFSNEERYGLYLFKSMKEGWSRKVLEGKAGDKNALPMITRKGTNNGVWFHSRSMWAQNESTNLLKDYVGRRSFEELLAGVEPTGKTPEASLRCLKARPGFVVEQVAAEPLVQDPIAFAWGPDGKLWVVEMGDYPLGIDGKNKPGGKVKFLEDIDGDGKYDKATVFLDGLNFPTSVLPWRKGVLITAAPDILYAEDVDGDGKADKKLALYTGFGEGNQQHRVNSLVWGLDNWIYCANGDSGGKVKSMKIPPNSPPSQGGDRGGGDIRGRDFRIRPDTGEIDLQSGQTQYGRMRDDWDNWFGNNNSNPTWHYALADHYLRRNPHLTAPDPRVQISVTPGAAPVFPISRTLPRFNSPQAFNHFTSACGPTIYRDELFGPEYLNNTFVSEPVHNLVHREIMTANGTTFSSRRAADEQTSEFLASSDNWFRPTSLQTGPDGALWVADMYRHVIEHPQWIPKEWQQRLDLRAGRDQGRIYRVYPADKKPRAIPRLDRLDTAGLVAALDSPNGWQRDMAQMMLVTKHDTAAVPLLEKQVVSSARPLCRLHALCTLDGLQALNPDLLRKALADAHPGIRRHAVRLSEGLLTKVPELGPILSKMVTDADPQVRMQLAYTLGEWNDPRAGQALGEFALKDAGDRFLSAAVMSSINKNNLDAMLATVLGHKTPPPAPLVENLLRLANALNHTRALVTLLESISTPEKGQYTPRQLAALAGLLDALDQRSTPLKKLHDSGDGAVKAAVKKLAALFDAARASLADKKAIKEDRLLAIRLLGRGLDRQHEDMTALAELLVPQSPDDIQAAAVAALGKLRDPRVSEVLLRGWKGHGPALRAQIFDVLFRREEWLRAVLDALEKKQLAAADLDAIRRQRLLEHKDPAIRQRVVKLFIDVVNVDRQKVIDAYQTVLTMKGDPAQGVKVFAKNCAACHKLGDVGNIVGPDLASLGDKSTPSLLIAVLDPNRAVETRYLNYSAITRNGLTLNGVLGSETGNSITLLGQDGKPQTILRSDLEELVSTGKSAMPEGLEKELKPQDMADLIAHIQAVGPQLKRKSFDGNKPELVKSAADGSLLLGASTCEIYGTSLVWEKQHGNLGYWNSDDDHAVWTVEVTRPGKYAVWLDWACVDTSAGKTFVLQAGTNELTGKVAGTGSWDNYRQARVGEIVLSAGTQRLTFRAARKLAASPLLDFKSLKLVPAGE